MYGHMDMEAINGKFKMRATEVTFAPGAYLGVHHHVGPQVLSHTFKTSHKICEVGFAPAGQT